MTKTELEREIKRITEKLRDVVSSKEYTKFEGTSYDGYLMDALYDLEHARSEMIKDDEH